MLRVEIIGNLGADPEQRYTESSGAMMTSIRVAVNSRRRNPDGEFVERTDWFRARTMGSKAEYVSRFTKGQRVLVIGRLEIGEYTSKDTDEVRTSYDIWADDVVNLSPREDNGQVQPQSASAARTERPRQPVVAGAGVGRPAAAADDLEDLDSLPF